MTVVAYFCKDRVDAAEWVDDPELSVEDTRDTLRDQAIINRLIGGAHATLAHALPLLRKCTSDPVRVLDAACGGADLSRWLVDEARRLGKRSEVTALDLSAKVIARARELCSGYPEITFITADALHPPFARGSFDIVLLPTFIHHLQPEQVVTLLRAVRDVSRGSVIVADLVRSPLAYLGFWCFSRLMGFSPVTIHDGQVSVRRAYTPGELAELAQRAGLEQWIIYRHHFYRMALLYPATEGNTV
ncbi:MAG TPA: methyltransferase domain-containing protein [Armatimonadota bacterium]|jgi:2-polyprenyl-3-methyl-5-hydroxy-6-metoxy-1,4-benzoquinol methylase